MRLTFSACLLVFACTDPPPKTATPEALVVPPVPPSAKVVPPPAPPPAPKTPRLTYDEALQSRKDVPPPADGPKLTDRELSMPMRDPSFLTVCGAPSSMKVTVRVVVLEGEPLGISVYTTPDDDAVVRCVKEHVDALRWPKSPFHDSFTTAY